VRVEVTVRLLRLEAAVKVHLAAIHQVEAAILELLEATLRAAVLLVRLVVIRQVVLLPHQEALEVQVQRREALAVAEVAVVATKLEKL
jgi:hypothetical protein